MFRVFLRHKRQLIDKMRCPNMIYRKRSPSLTLRAGMCSSCMCRVAKFCDAVNCRKWLCRVATILLAILASMRPDATFADETLPLETELASEGIASLAKAAQEDGDARRGAILFHQRNTSCSRCHATTAAPSALGPNLAKPNPKRTPAHIVESILVPSKVVAKEFQASQIIMEDGRILMGIVKEATRDEVTLLLPLETGRVTVLSRKDVDEVNPSPVSIMPTGLVNQLADRQQFLDLVRYVIEISTRGSDAVREWMPDPSQLRSFDDGPIDHAKQIEALASSDLETGKQLYTRYCVNCHGHDGNKTLNPLARRFAKDPLKFGTDPYSMWKTISYGNGLMFPQAGLLAANERYLVVNYIREQFLRTANPTQYFEPDESYFDRVNQRAEDDTQQFGPVKLAVAAGMLDGQFGKQMDYGSYLSHSIAFSDPPNKNAERFEDTTERAMVIRLPGEHVVCYDVERGSVAGIWQGKIANTDKSHHTSYKGNRCLTPGGDVRYKNVDDQGWQVNDVGSATANGSSYTFLGHFLHCIDRSSFNTMSARVVSKNYLRSFHPIRPFIPGRYVWQRGGGICGA